MDKISRMARSLNMSHIKAKNTKPELLVRKALFQRGLRYRIHYPLPGKPDVVFPSRRIAIFINGCFWHGHDCADGHIPKSHIPFWLDKIKQNKERDKRNHGALTRGKWKVDVLWECEIIRNCENIAENIYNEIQHTTSD